MKLAGLAVTPSAAGLYALSSLSGDARLPVDAASWATDGAVRVLLPAKADLAEGEPVILQLWAKEASPGAGDAGVALYFYRHGQALVHEGEDKHLARITGPDGALVGPAQLLAAPPELAHLAPWDNPALSPEARAFTAKRFGATAPAPIAIQTGALTSERSAAPTTDVAPEVSSGCQTGEGSSVVLVVVLGLLALSARRRRGAITIAAFVVVGAPTLARATQHVVYGYTSFWDTRANPSNLPGSRLPICVPTNTTCGPSDGPACCFRAIPNATVSVSQGGVELDTFESWYDGFFVLSFSGNDLTHYQLDITFHRDGEPGLTRLTLNNTALGLAAPPARKLVKLDLAGAGTYVYLPSVSANAAYDTTSAMGNIASVWATVTDTQYAIAAEGDTRYRRVFGAADTDPDDLTLVRYTTLKTPYFQCNNGLFNTYDTNARSLQPAALEGFIYHGRVVGCASPLGSYTYPAFPPNPGLDTMSTFGSEGVALALAYSVITSMLSRWDPDVALLSDIKAAPGMACVANGLPNSNEAANTANTALALWEFIDTDTTGASGGVDSCDITMGELMDGLLLHSTITGSPGQNLTSAEPVYATTARTCNNFGNEQCERGEACLRLSGSIDSRCWTGDPHGANVYDVTFWTWWAAVLGGWSGAGDFVNTLDSSACLSTPDDDWSFDGSCRMD